jgi:hypothetical protein
MKTNEDGKQYPRALDKLKGRWSRLSSCGFVALKSQASNLAVSYIHVVLAGDRDYYSLDISLRVSKSDETKMSLF